MAKAILYGVLSVFICSVQAWAQQPRPRIAVLNFKAEGITESEAAIISDRLRSGFVNLGVFRVLDRGEIESVLNEQVFQQQGLTESERVLKIGHLLNAEFIITGRIRLVKGTFYINTRMINAQTAEIVRSEDIYFRGNINDLLSENLDSVAARPASRAATIRLFGGAKGDRKAMLRKMTGAWKLCRERSPATGYWPSSH